VLNFALQQGFDFLSLLGERDEQHEFGLAIPIHGWVIDLDHFRTAASNFFDHEVLGNSNIFFPLTIERARIRGWEGMVRSPQLWGRIRFHLVYSNQVTQGQGGVTGGLTDFSAPSTGFFFLDHDQRNTLNIGWEATLPWRSWASVSVNYGSGFLNGDGPDHLPPHTTLSIALGKSFGGKLSLQFSALNLGNSHFLLDNSNTFGGTHFNNPRQFIGGGCATAFITECGRRCRKDVVSAEAKAGRNSAQSVACRHCFDQAQPILFFAGLETTRIFPSPRRAAQGTNLDERT